MNMTKRLGGKLGIVLCSALFGYTTYGQPSVSVGLNVPLPSVEVVLPSVEIHAESDFYEPLTSYGRWEVVGSYGRCWIPGRVEADWRPYSDGYWQRTDAGWYWASDEPWGWATYHYGRWDLSADFGWYWVPQTQWAPAWVSWHEGGGYIGWAPLQPSVRISASGYVGFDVALVSPRAFVFVEQRRFLDPIRPATVVVNNTSIINKTTVISNTRIVNNSVINEGPAPTVIEKASGRKIEALPVQEIRHKTEAAVVAKQRAPKATSETGQPPARNEAQPGKKKAGAASASPQVEQPAAATQEPAAPAPKSHEAQSKKQKSAPEFQPVPAAPEFKPKARPEGNPPAIKEPTQPKADKHVAQPEKPAKSSEKKVQQPAAEQPAASESNGTEPADKGHGKKHKE